MAAHSGAMATRSRTRRAAPIVGLRTNGPTSTRPDTSPGRWAAARTAEPAPAELDAPAAEPAQADADAGSETAEK